MPNFIIVFLAVFQKKHGFLLSLATIEFYFLLNILSYLFKEKLHGFGVFSADNVEQID